MKTKKYFKLILKPYNIILKNFDNDIRVSVGKSFCCYPRTEEKTIEVPILEDKNGREYFYNKMIRRLRKEKIKGEYSCEILSFLHEIGHIYTYNVFFDFTYGIGTFIIKTLQNKFSSPKLLHLFHNLYFNLQLEKRADKWVTNFIKNNQKLVNEWQQMLQKNYNKVLPKFIDHMKYKYKINLV